MAQEEEERITYRCEFHESINQAELALNQVFRYLGWDELWPPTEYRENITATGIIRSPKGGRTRRVIFTFTNNSPYKTVQVYMSRYISIRWFADWVVIEPTPDYLRWRASQLNKGLIYIKLDACTGEPQEIDPQLVPDELKMPALA